VYLRISHIIINKEETGTRERGNMWNIIPKEPYKYKKYIIISLYWTPDRLNSNKASFLR